MLIFFLHSSSLTQVRCPSAEAALWWEDASALEKREIA